METPSVGIREFRASLAEYIETDAPVTITRHGQVVGLFVPLRQPSTADIERLRAASEQARAALPLDDAELEQVVAEFDALRRGKPVRGRKTPAR
jgi:antitoxin (DNA-binding transcriptional repressor) of toxin-antitoxin stability system